MPRNRCGRHGNSPCSCGMGNIYRFVEPVVLFLLKTKGHAHGYELARDMTDCSLTDAAIDLGGLYRVLQRLEVEALVASEWDTSGSGPARRVYSITPAGEYRLREWVAVIGDMSNDLPMFEIAGLAIAMGNGADEVKEKAHFVTVTNEEEGIAHAIDRFVLPRAPGGPASRLP